MKPLVRDALPWLQKPLCFVGAHYWHVHGPYRCCAYCHRIEDAVTIRRGGDERLIGWKRSPPPR